LYPFHATPGYGRFAAFTLCCVALSALYYANFDATMLLGSETILVVYQMGII